MYVCIGGGACECLVAGGAIVAALQTEIVRAARLCWRLMPWQTAEMRRAGRAQRRTERRKRETCMWRVPELGFGVETLECESTVVGWALAIAHWLLTSLYHSTVLGALDGTV